MEGNKLSTPQAIIIAGIIIAAVIFFTSNAGTNLIKQGDRAQDIAPAVNDNGGDDVLENIAPLSQDDHVLGGTNPKVVIIEYSDLDCPFCQRFHMTMKQIVDDYEGDVAWVYRHFPLDSIHPNARTKAEATECAAELGGNEGFWMFTDALFENATGVSELGDVAEAVGLDKIAFQECLDSGRSAKKVEEDSQNAIAIGGTGTPFSVVIAADGSKLPINGAQPVAAVKSIIDLALEQ